MIKTRTARVLNVTDLFSLNYALQRVDWDLFDTRGILQRDLNGNHRDAFTELASNNSRKNPGITVFDTPLICRLIPKPRCEAKLVTAIEKGKPFTELVESCYMIDGQHRAEGLIKLPIEEFDKVRFDVTFVVCDDLDAEGMFSAINGKGRKMSPAAVDLASAHQVMNGIEMDTKDTVRGIASLIVKYFIERANHPYCDRVEKPFARPKVTSPLLRFHRTVNSTHWLARTFLNQLRDRSPEYFASPDFEFSIKQEVGKLVTVWQAISIVLCKQIFGHEACYGTVERMEDWVHAHVFGILNASIVPHCFEAISRGELQPDVLSVAKYIERPLHTFFDDGKKEQDPNMLAGFNNMGGDSPDLKYITKLRGYLHLCGQVDQPHAELMSA